MQTQIEDRKESEKKSFVLKSIFCVGVIILLSLVLYCPELSTQDKSRLQRIPRNGEDLQGINEVIQKYKREHSVYVYVAFCYLYIFLQSFAIPGPLILSILSGALFGGLIGFSLVCLCASTGASLCYLLSYSLGRQMVMNQFPSKMALFQQKTQENKDQLFWWLLFLRITPLLPNWFINLGSPLVNISFPVFFLATFFGIMPANLIHVRTGLFLHDLDKIGLDLSSILSLALLGLLALLPILYKQKYKQKQE